MATIQMRIVIGVFRKKQYTRVSPKLYPRYRRCSGSSWWVMHSGQGPTGLY